MPKSILHLDEDTSDKRLHQALLQNGHDVTRTPNEWAPKGFSDVQQLLSATEKGRVICTFNVQGFIKIAPLYPQHAGILLITRRKWTLTTLIYALDRVLIETTSTEWIGQVRWLSQWR